jgi:hypothetical protein
VPVRERVLMRVEEKAVVQYACDGERFAVSVRDAFGSLRKETILTYLDKCLHSPDQIDRKAAGAGLGLFLICNSATDVGFHIFAGSATEVVCAFDLSAPRAQLRSLGVFQEHIEGVARPSGPLQTVPSRRGRRREDLVPAASARTGVLLPAMMTFAVLLLLFAVTLVALPYVKRPVAAALQIESDPPGATIYLDGRARGVAPLRVPAEGGRSYALRAVKQGFHDDEQLVTAAAGDSTVRLHLEEVRAGVAVESEPAGAHVFVGGKDSGKLTPTTVEAPPQTMLAVTLKKDGFMDEKLSAVAPPAGERASYHATLKLLPNVSLLTIATEPQNANVFVDGLQLAPPAPSHDTFVASGARHRIKASAPGFVDIRSEVVVAGGEHKSLQLKLIEGGMLALKTNVAAKVIIDDKPVGTAPLSPVGLSAGEHTLALRGKTPAIDYSTKISVDKGRTLEVKLDFNDDHTVEGRIGDKTVTDKW